MSERYENLSRDELVRLLVARDRRDAPRFGLVWESNEIERDKALNADFVALDLVPELSVGDPPWRNLIIEADNFDALRCLRMAFAGRVKCILIDPPYNRGKKDFIYNDSFVDENDLWRFSKWIEFLYQRLILARDLLSEDGVLLCFINDDNRAKLELLLDKVFPGMRMGSLVWRTRDSTSAKGRNFSDVHEHILIYARPGFEFRGREKTQKKYKNPDNDPRGPWNIDPLTLGFNRFERANLFYPVQNPKTGRWYPCDANLVWRYASEKIVKDSSQVSTETMEEWIRQDKIIFPDLSTERVVVWNTMGELLAAIDEKDVPVTPKKKIPLLTRDTPNLDFWIGKPVGFGRPGFKKHWKDLRSHVSPVSSWISRMNEDADEEETVTFRSREAGEGTGVLQAIFGQTMFNYPKPPSVLRQLVEQATALDSIVVDFFGGSGTAAQAVLEQNVADGGTRRFILVSSTEATAEEPGKNICRDVCGPRVKAVIQGFGGNEPTGGDFVYLRTCRVERGRLTKLDHAQVWAILQLIHGETVAPYEERRWQWAGNEEQALLYVPRFRREDATALRKQVSQSAGVILYSWQSELIRQHVPAEHVQFEHLPESLSRRFGLKG